MTSSPVPNDIRRDLAALLPRLRRFALTLTNEASAADALVQDVCARAIQKSHHWKGEGRLESWVFNLIRTAWSDDGRKRGRQDGQVPHDEVEVRDGGTEAATALSCLPQGLTSCVLLVDVEGFSYTESASILGIREELLASRLCAARLYLSSMPVVLAERRA